MAGLVDHVWDELLVLQRDVLFKLTVALYALYTQQAVRARTTHRVLQELQIVHLLFKFPALFCVTGHVVRQ